MGNNYTHFLLVALSNTLLLVEEHIEVGLE